MEGLQCVKTKITCGEISVFLHLVKFLGLFSRANIKFVLLSLRDRNRKAFQIFVK